MYRIGIYCVTLLYLFCPTAFTDTELSPKMVYTLIMARIDDIVFETKTLKSELVNIHAVVVKLGEKIERIENNITQTANKMDKSEEKYAKSPSTEQGKSKQYSFGSLNRRTLKRKSTTLRKMLADEKSHMRKTVEKFEERLNKFETDIQSQLTRLNNSFKASLDILNESIADSSMSLNVTVQSFDDRINEHLHEINSTMESRLIQCDTKIAKLLFAFNLTLQNEKDGVGNKESDFQSMSPKQDPCKVPYDYAYNDTLISISNKDSVSLSGGAVVNSTEYIFFNCSKANEMIYEPLNRRFKCENGSWIEDDKDKSWKFGNNGTFPRCRKAKCNPKCQNGGVCSKDNYCRCKHLTKGKLCEKVVCGDKCITNGGKCIGPGKCECPAGKFGKNCQQSGCKLPKESNMAQLNSPKEVFAPGEIIKDFRCESGYSLSTQNGMTCQENGEWSAKVECIKDVVYLIEIQTGSIKYAGTDAKVYITLYGARGSTKRIYLDGKFENNDVDKFRISAKDIRPIKSVMLQHDGSGVGPLWYLEYVSIYVEDMEEFYVFRNTKHAWVKEDEDLILYREGNDDCISSFGEELKWYPRWRSINDFKLGSGEKMSLRTCKQACVNTDISYCRGVYYNSYDNGPGGICFGFRQTNERYFNIRQRNMKASFYIRKCKEDV